MNETVYDKIMKSVLGTLNENLILLDEGGRQRLAEEIIAKLGVQGPSYRIVQNNDGSFSRIPWFRIDVAED